MRRKGRSGDERYALSFDIPGELKIKLVQLAVADRRPLAQFLRNVLEDHVSRAEQTQKRHRAA